ncbi:hypothetical protein B0T11DRAFT_280575 [Plectosphaerella cucumerina]|uniref:Uncharacterized protein n=1 Tax=Plectosphaerella cucumerina TaxID=40658 RepID=A0A8K0TCW1_9PEZI|nr:hypothetical protein B0T11DRAFT_280575 [Plectosphaerella cucumerina]
MAQPSPSVQPNGVPSPAPVAEAVGTPDPAHPTAPVKRKREDDGETPVEDTEMKMDVDDDKPSLADLKDSPALVRDYVTVITSYDTTPSILKRPLPEVESGDEPDAKRHKTTNGTSAATIADKAARDQYALLDDLAADIVAAVDDRLDELRSKKNTDTQQQRDKSIAEAKSFREKALDLFRRETSYPRGAFDIQQKMLAQPASIGGAPSANTVLSVYSNAGGGKQLFSSLIEPADDGSVKPLPEVGLPPGVSLTHILPTRQSDRTYTIGELFGPPRALPPLQHQSRTQSKGNVLKFIHPELAEKSKFRSNTYFSQKISVGHYLDYSNAAPASPNRSNRQRSRAESLAGRKPTAAEQELAELDTLFRSAFSSFAPTKDDSGAMVPANTAAQIYWQQTGYRAFDQMIDRDTIDDETALKPRVTELEELDEKLIADAIDNFDSSMVDPALASILDEPKSAEEKEADDLLDEVNDLIETLASHQRIRNLSLATQQNRYAGEPAGGDLLNTPVVPPSEEEIATYEALKAQLSLMIKMMPPFAVAKLNGEQLDELLVSTKIEVLTANSKGVLEDEAAVQARLRQQQSAAVASAARPTANHRTPSSASYGNQYGANQYGTPSRQPMAQQNFYRPPGQTPHQQPHAMARPSPGMQHQQHRPQPPQQQYRPTNNGYPTHLAAQMAKTQTPFGHQQVPQYGQQRPPQQYPYAGTPQHASPVARFQPTYAQGFQPPPQHHQQPQPGTPGSYTNYANGAAPLQPRTISPQVPYSPSPPMQQQQHGPHHPPRQGSYPQHPQGAPQHYQQPHQQQHYQQQPHQPHQQQYRPPQQNMPGTPVHHQAYPNGVPQGSPTPHQQQGAVPMGGGQDQNQRMLEQARARAAAQQNSAAFGKDLSQQGNVSGLAGIGLGGNFNAAQYAAQQARMSGGVGSPASASPRPPSTGPNGTPSMPPSVSPVPAAVQVHHQQMQPQQ